MKASREYTHETLEALPEQDGFRQRGMEMTRLETFTDAAFAFAVTLLVVGGGDTIPVDFEEMIEALKQIPAFAASFANIMLFWYAHHVWSRRFGLDDAASVTLSLLLIFVVLIYVYPLKAIYSGAFEFFSGGFLESFFKLRSIDDLRSMFVIFGTGFSAMSAVIILLNRHALARRDVLALSALEIFDVQTGLQQLYVYVAVPLVSIALALAMPDRFVVSAGLFYMVIGAVMPWLSVRRARAREYLRQT